MDNIASEDWFRSMSPYHGQDFKDAIKRLSNFEGMLKGIQFFYPELKDIEIKDRLLSCEDSDAFQLNFFKGALERILQSSASSFNFSIDEHLKDYDSCLILSNHRDILLDAGFLQLVLLETHLGLSEISLGSNLMMSPEITDFAKINKMYTTHRYLTGRDLIKNLQQLSEYLRYTVQVKKKSAWLAQGNGRTKDGYDVFQPSLLKMLMSGQNKKLKENLEDFNICIQTISYEYEPCDVEKAMEQLTVARSGEYIKKPGEDWETIVKGVKQFKGHVFIALEKLQLNEIPLSGHLNDDVMEISRTIDNINTKNYKLYPINYVALDLCNECDDFVDQYTIQDVKKFKEYVKERIASYSDEDKPELEKLMYEMYANPARKFITQREFA